MKYLNVIIILLIALICTSGPLEARRKKRPAKKQEEAIPLDISSLHKQNKSSLIEEVPQETFIAQTKNPLHQLENYKKEPSSFSLSNDENIDTPVTSISPLEELPQPIEQTFIQKKEKTSSIVEVDELITPSALEENKTEWKYEENSYSPPLFPAEQAASEPKDVLFNFEDAELKSFINYIAEMHDINIIPDATIDGNKISLNIRKPISKSGAWNLFWTILDTAGFALIKNNNFYKILPKDKATKQPLPVFINTHSEDLPDNDAVIRYVVFLENIPVKQAEPILTSMLAQGSINTQPNANGMIITEKCMNIKSAMKVIHELDQTGLQESVSVIKLDQANAQDVKTLFDSLINKKNSSASPLARLLGKQNESSTEYFNPTTKIVVEPRTNSLIMLGNKQSLERIENFITNHIDKELKEARSPLRIKDLQHADAEEVKNILIEVTNSANIQSAAGQQAVKYGAIRDGVKMFKKMTFQADKEANRIICSSTSDHDWALVEDIIKDLDKAQPQVAVQMLVVTINFNDLNQIGGQIRNEKDGQIGKNISFQSTPFGNNITHSTTNSLLGDLISGITLEQGSTLFSIGKTISDGGGGLWGIFKMLKQQTNATLISQPFLVTSNRTKGHIEFGDTKWVDFQNAVSDNTGNIGSATGKKEVSAKTVVDITPQISVNGVIKMLVNMSIKEFVDTTGETTQEKKLNTNITAGDGQVLVLGGFVKTKTTESGAETPVLSKIPVLGWLFKNKQRNVSKDYVFIFLSPTIIKPRTKPGVELYTKMKLHQAREEISDTIQTGRTKDPIHNWFFNPTGEEYSHKVTDFANARYQPTTVDLEYDEFYKTKTVKHATQKIINSEEVSPQDYIRENVTKKTPEQNMQKALVIASQKEPTRKASKAPAQKEKLVVKKTHFEPKKQTVSIAKKKEESSSLDAEIAAKRAKLKELLNTQSFLDLMINKEENKSEDTAGKIPSLSIESVETKPSEQLETTLADKSIMQRDMFKELLKENPVIDSEQEGPTQRVADARNQLKDFLKTNSDQGIQT